MTTVDDDADVRFRPGFDHATDPALLRGHPVEWDRLREDSRAFRSDAAKQHGNTWDNWYLLRFDDVYEAFQRHDLFSSRQTLYLVEDAHRWIPNEVDPPEHTRYRTALNPMFSPKAIGALEPEIRSLAASLVDSVAGAGACDAVLDVARPLPTTIFMQMMGMPVEQAPTFLAWASDMLHATAATDPDGAVRKRATKAIYGYLRELVAERRARPEDDIVSRLMAVDGEGGPFSDDELLEMSMLLYIAGMDTVAGVLSYVFLHLALHAEERRRLVDDRTAVPSFVEECLRFYSIVSVARVVRDDTAYAGCPLRRDDRVVLCTGAANRDPRQFYDADRFVGDRSPNRHIAFGAGIHRCLGSHLARLELRIAVEEWLARIPDFEVAPHTELRHHVGGAAGLDALPLVWR